MKVRAGVLALVATECAFPATAQPVRFMATRTIRRGGQASRWLTRPSPVNADHAVGDQRETDPLAVAPVKGRPRGAPARRMDVEATRRVDGAQGVVNRTVIRSG